MAKVKVHGASRQFGGATPYGNLTTLLFAMTTLATGAVAGSSSETPLAVGDVVDLGPLPEGMRLEDASVFIGTGLTASVTGSLGFEYEDGEDSTKVPQDAAYFLKGANLATSARLRANTANLVTLPKPARLILTIAGAANAKASDVKIVVHGELTGPL